MNETTNKLFRRAGSAVLIAGLLVFNVACGDDDDATSTTTEAAAQTTTTKADPVDEPADGGEHDHFEVTAVDFSFEDLPSEIKAGTRLSLVNAAETELHELVAIRLPDDETRPVSELVTLPQEELGAIMTSEPQAVLLAEPGGEQIPAVGDGTLTEPGRYIVLCAIPTGVDPAEYLAAAAQSQGGPPTIENAGPPHFASGMFAELTVVP
jgi:hypothetical protein